jgi:hypothetical protein
VTWSGMLDASSPSFAKRLFHLAFLAVLAESSASQSGNVQVAKSASGGSH